MGRTRTAAPDRSKSYVLRGLAVLLGLGVFFLLIAEIAKRTRAGIRDWDRYTLAFKEIDCTAPPAEDRVEFLAEVQYLAGMADQFQLVDEGVAQRLAAAFALHPWVERVERVTVLPSRRVEIRLVFRTPVLELMPAPPEQPTWLIDAQTILLPKKAWHERLPILIGPGNPKVAGGQPWGDAGVEAAAKTARFLRVHEDKLNLQFFEITPTGLILSTPASSRVLWGHAPGQEKPGEVTAAQKLERLLGYCKSEGSLDKPAGRYEHDVRPAERALNRPLAP